MIYVPDINYACYVVIDNETIRAYETMPTQDSTVNYRDYYINSNYLYEDSYQTFSRYSTLPICLDNNLITNEIYYRNDFDSILVIFLIMTIFIIYIPLKIFSRLFKRGNLWEEYGVHLILI